MTLDTSTSANKSSPQSVNVIKKSRTEVIKTIQEIAKVDEATINQAIEACQDNEGRYSMDTVLNILMDEKYSFEQKNRDNKADSGRFSRQYGVSPTSNEDSNKNFSKKNYQLNKINESSFGTGNNMDDEDDDEYDQMANSDTRDHHKFKNLESELIREEGKPCGLRNVGNTCWFNSIIQSLFHLPGFRQIILSFRLSENDIPKLDDRDRNMVLFVAELRKLFAQMLKSKRRVINPNPTLKCLKNCSKFDSEMSNQEDVSEFMTILVNIIEESFEKLSNLKLSQTEETPAIETENLVSKLNEQLNIKPVVDFRSETKNIGPKKSKNNPIVNLLDGEIIVKRKDSEGNSESSISDIFREVNIQMLNSRNLHAGLELEWGETLIDKQITDNNNVSSYSGKNEPGVNRSIYQQESWVKKLPRVLFICLNRYKFVQATQSSSKILEPFEFYQQVYLDRYLDENKQIIIQKRKEVKVLREELKNLENKLNSIKKYRQESGNTMALDEALKCVLNFVTADFAQNEVFQQIKPVSETALSETTLNDSSSLKTVEKCLTNWINRTQQKINELNEAIIKIKHKIDTAFDENYLKKYKYNLHSVCIHEGTSISGHFWTYIWSPKQSKWFKYNDTEVCETTWEDVYANSIGGSSQNNLNQLNDLNDLSKTKTRSTDRIPSAYFLIYTRADDLALYNENVDLGSDIEEFLKNDRILLDNKLNKLKYKRVLEDLMETLNKTNELMVQNKLSNEQNNQTCLEHAKAFHDSTLEALMASYDKISVDVVDHPAAEEALKFAIDYELKKYTQSKSEIEEKLPETDIRMNHILIYANANIVSNELKQIALLDLFRMQIFQDSDIRLKILQTLAQIKYNEYILKPFNTPGQASPGSIPLMKHYENFLNDYRDYRSIIAAFINAVNFMESQRFEDAAQFFCVACEYNERIISTLDLKMKGMHHEFLLANRRKCLKIWNQSTIRKFTIKNSRTSDSNNFDQTGARLQQLNQQDLNSLIEIMINKFLPCFFRLYNSTEEDKAMIDEIRQDWLNVLDSNLPGIQLFHDFMAKLFEEPVSSHYHSLNVNKSNLQNRYQEAVQLTRNI